MKTISSPTKRTYENLDAAFKFFNAKLFGGELPACLITVQRHKGAYGYFCGERFADINDAENVADEIALNPTHFGNRPAKQTLSTLVHEMCHLWQHHFGTPPRKCYHNREWSEKMEEVGLTPSDTGMPGGRKVGQKVSHVIEIGGRFDIACDQFIAKTGAVLFADRAGEPAEKERKKSSKTKYTCPTCGQNAWAKPETNLMCGDCEKHMEAEESEDD